MPDTSTYLAHEIVRCLLDMRIGDAFDLMSRDGGRDGFTCFVHGVVHEAMDQPSQALKCYREAASRNALSAEEKVLAEQLKSWLIAHDPSRTHFVDGETLKDLMDRSRKAYADGAKAYALTLANVLTEKAPETASAWTWRGNLYRREGRLGEALACYWRSADLKPQQWDVHRAIGQIQRYVGQTDNAIASYMKALIHKPDFVQGYRAVGDMMVERNQIDDALVWYRKAMKCPDGQREVRIHAALAELKLGHWARGRSLLAARFAGRDDEARYMTPNRWTKENAGQGHLAVWKEVCKPEDEVLYLSAIPELMRLHGHDFTLEVSPPLYELTRQSFPDVNVLAFNGYDDRPMSASHQISLGDLFFALKSDSDIAPYLLVDKGGLLADKGAEGTRTGVFLKGVGDEERDLILSELAGDGIEIAGDVGQIAQALRRCRRVIAVDGLIARMAGAMGLDVRVLLPFAPGWMWGVWPRLRTVFETCTIYQTVEPDDWHRTVSQLLSDLSDERALSEQRHG